MHDRTFAWSSDCRLPRDAGWAVPAGAAAVGLAGLIALAWDATRAHHADKPVPRAIMGFAFQALALLVASMAALAAARGTMEPAPLVLLMLAVETNAASVTFIIWSMMKLALSVQFSAHIPAWRRFLCATRTTLALLLFATLGFVLAGAAAAPWLLLVIAADSAWVGGLVVLVSRRIMAILCEAGEPVSASQKPLNATAATPFATAAAAAVAAVRTTTGSSSRSLGTVSVPQQPPQRFKTYYTRVRHLYLATLVMTPCVVAVLAGAFGVHACTQTIPYQYAWLAALMASMLCIVGVQWYFATRSTLPFAPRASFTALRSLVQRKSAPLLSPASRRLTRWRSERAGVELREPPSPAAAPSESAPGEARG